MLLLPLVGLWLRVRGFQRTREVLGTISELNVFPLRAERNDQRSIRAVARAVDIAARYSALGRVSCLRRSLVLWCLLREIGIASDIQIGVRMAGGGLNAHAWVLSHGAVLNDDPDIASRFVPLHLR